MSAPTIPPVSTMGTAVPYITLPELKRSPIYSQLEQLVPNSSDAARDAELERIVARVSAMINGEVNQNLAATLDKEVGRVRVDDFGDLRIHCRSTPVIDVQSISVGANPYGLTQLTDLSHIILDPWRITLPQAGGMGLQTGNLPLGGSFRPGSLVWCEWSYINGFPITTIAEDVNAGDTEITVVDPTGILPNQTILTVEDGIDLETVVPTAVNGDVLTVPPLLFSHSATVGIHAMPGDVKEAALILVSRLHDTWSLSMGAISMGDGTGAHMTDSKPRFMCDPAWILNPYKRRW